MNYTILKAIHLIAILAWSAGLFYIGRIFVYYVESNSSEVKATLGNHGHSIESVYNVARFNHNLIGWSAYGWCDWRICSRLVSYKVDPFNFTFWISTYGLKICKTAGEGIIPKIITLVQGI